MFTVVRMWAGVSVSMHGNGLRDLNFLSAPKAREPMLSHHLSAVGQRVRRGGGGIEAVDLSVNKKMNSDSLV